MFPTSTLPVSPFLGHMGMGTVIGVVAVGALVALLVGLLLHRRELQAAPTIELPETTGVTPETAKPSRARLSA